MDEKVTDLIYSLRSLIEILVDRPDLLDHDEELSDSLEDVEEKLDLLTSIDKEEEVEIEAKPVIDDDDPE